MMNKKLLKSLLGLSCLSLLVSCNTQNSESATESNTNSESATESNTNSETQEVNRPTYDYILEDGETYQKIKVETRTLNKLSYNSISIAGVEYLAVDPFTTSYFYGEASVAYPTSELLEGETILYTSAWYKQTTFKRNDECVEYVLYNDLGEWYVENISNTSETFIPFNGAVLSVPKNSSFVLSVGDAIVFTNGSIPTYDVGLYNQEGNRMAIRYANESLWAEKGANLYDSNYLSLVTPTRWYTTATINFAYDKSSNTYYVDKFRNNNYDARIYTNINKDGFMVGASLNGDDENVAVYEGVRFNLYDTIKVEENPGIASTSFEFSMNKENTYRFSDGSTAKFTLAKSTAAVASKTRRWKFEFAVN